jgi:hypothetical protein
MEASVLQDQRGIFTGVVNMAREQIKKFTKSQLDAVLVVLESLDTDNWSDEIEEFGLCDAVSDVESLLEFVKKVRKGKS